MPQLYSDDSILRIVRCTPQQCARRRSSSFCLVLALLTAFAMPVAAKKSEGKSKGPPDVTQAAKKAGLRVLQSELADFDGDDKDEVIAACKSKRGILLCVFSSTVPPKLLHKLPAAPGNKLGKLTILQLTPPENAVEVALEHYDENPDEKVKRIRVYTGYRKPRQIFSSVIFRSKDKSQRPSWETTPGVVKYGNARPGWYYADLDGDGITEIIVRDKPQLLQVKRDRGDAHLLTGVREKVYEFVGRADQGTFVAREKLRFNDFLPAYEVESVTGSSAWIPPTLKQELESEAMAAAVYAATDADDDDIDSLPEVVEIDLKPFYAHVADKNLNTAWVEDVKGQGTGEYVELHFEEARPIHMVRVVSGCVESKKTFRSHNVPTKFEISLGSKDRAFVDREEPKRPLRPALAILELPIKGRRYAKQTLVFFKGEIEAARIRVTLREARRLGRANRTCISEISVH